MQQPDNAQLLTQAEFLNEQFDEKAFSWTLAMEAMETVLPAGVQVTSIEPQRGKDGHITVELRVVGPHDRSVDLVRNLEHSRRFLEPRIESESAENSTNSNQQLGPVSASNRFEFELFADYNPPAPGERVSAEKSTAGTPASQTPASAHPPHLRVVPAIPQQRGRGPYTGPAQPPPHTVQMPPHPAPADERRPAMSATQSHSTWRERLASPLTWHMAGFFLLLALAVALAIRLGLDWAVMDSHSSEVLAGKQIQLKALEIQTTPLRGLDQRVEKTREQLDDFYQKRIPPNYSSIDARIVELQVASGVRLTRVQYTQGAPGPGLTEITMDASISGDYPAIMRFVNSMERDPMFFIIRAMALTGQQGGLVNLRLRVSTWLRPADVPSGLPFTQPPGNAPAPEQRRRKEGE